jgi:hypothetical protein
MEKKILEKEKCWNPPHSLTAPAQTSGCQAVLRGVPRRGHHADSALGGTTGSGSRAVRMVAQTPSGRRQATWSGAGLSSVFWQR